MDGHTLCIVGFGMLAVFILLRMGLSAAGMWWDEISSSEFSAMIYAMAILAMIGCCAIMALMAVRK
jgi:hypothetical protein